MCWIQREGRNATEQKRLGGGEIGIIQGRYLPKTEFSILSILKPSTQFGHQICQSQARLGEGDPAQQVSKAKAFASSALIEPVATSGELTRRAEGNSFESRSSRGQLENVSPFS